MGCAVLSVLVGMPRVAIGLLWLFLPGWLIAPFPHRMLPLLGFAFLPYSTLGWCFAANHLGAPPDGPLWGWVAVILGVALDLGVIGGSGAGRRSSS